jgi:hypothetical protein
MSFARFDKDGVAFLDSRFFSDGLGNTDSKAVAPLHDPYVRHANSIHNVSTRIESIETFTAGSSSPVSPTDQTPHR